MKTLSITLSLMLALVASARAADQFTPNHLFATGVDTNTSQPSVFEFDEGGSLVRAIPVAAEGLVYGIAFGPDGNIYAALMSDNKVVRVTPTLATNVILSASDGLMGPEGLSFGPDGTLFVGNVFTNIVVTRRPDGTVSAITPGDTNTEPVAVSFGVAGNRYVSDDKEDDGPEIREQDPSGREIRILGQGAFIGGSLANVAEGPGGLLYVADYSTNIYVFSSSGTLHSTIQHPDIQGAFGLAFGPNGNLFVCCWDSSSVIEFTPAGTHVRTITLPRMVVPSYLAFAPYRFTASLKGTIAATGSSAAKLAEKNAVLSITPGSRTIMLSVTNNLANPASYASLFGGQWHVFRGFENFSGATSVSRLYLGSQVNNQPSSNGVGSVSLTVKGAVGSNGWFAVKSMSGSLQRASDAAQFKGTVSGKPIK